jgi:hypothetical protein
MKSKKILSVSGFLLLTIAFIIYASIYIEKTSFTLDGVKYYALFDDAMISMRYARNLAEGHGLVWNPGGDRVEGFSNPLWVGLMTLFHLLPIPINRVSLYVQTSGALFLVVNLVFVKQITNELTNDWLTPLLAVFLTAFYYPLNNWGLQGMEVSILVMIVSITVWKTIRDQKEELFTPWPYLLLGFSTWFRIDMAAPLAVLTAFLFLFDRKHRKQHFWWGMGTFVFFLAIQTLLRLWYFGEPLPNTYYLKVGGAALLTRLKYGLKVVLRNIWVSNWILFVLPLALLLFKRDKKTLLLFTLFLGQIAYSVYVGGDAWEHKGGANRFISITIPLFFIIFSLTLYHLRTSALRYINKQNNNWSLWTSRMVTSLLVFISIFNFNTVINTNYPNQWLLKDDIPPLFVPGTMAYTQMGLMIKEVTTPEASVAVVTAGNIPYFAERFAIDLLGKNDKVVARTEPHIHPGLFNPQDDYRSGHLKWDYPYSIGELEPDVIAQIWKDTVTAQEAMGNNYKYVELKGVPMWLRIDSPNIRWEKVDTYYIPASEELSEAD